MNFLLQILYSLLLLHVTKAVKLGFGELDYVASEGNGEIVVVVTKSEEITANLTVPIKIFTIGEFYSMGRTLTSEFSGLNIPDEAEYSSDPSGRRDFVRSESIQVTFTPSSEPQSQRLSIPLVNDDINEAEEGFFVTIMSDDIFIPEKTVELVRGGVTLAKIDDDDPIKLGFELDQYTFLESNVSSEVFVTKGGVASEQVLSLLVEAPPDSPSITKGQDFTIEQVIPLIFQPGVPKLPVPFDILDDSIPEEKESFTLFLAINETKRGLELGTSLTTINIIDDDFLDVGFEHPSYTVNEGDKNITVCVEIKAPENFTLMPLLNLQTVGVNATENEDFEPLSTLINLRPALRKECYTIPIKDDNVTESNETFNITLTPFEVPGFPAPDNIRLLIPQTVITIINNEPVPLSTTALPPPPPTTARQPPPPPTTTRRPPPPPTTTRRPPPPPTTTRRPPPPPTTTRRPPPPPTTTRRPPPPPTTTRRPPPPPTTTRRPPPPPTTTQRRPPPPITTQRPTQQPPPSPKPWAPWWPPRLPWLPWPPRWLPRPIPRPTPPRPVAPMIPVAPPAPMIPVVCQGDTDESSGTHTRRTHTRRTHTRRSNRRRRTKRRGGRSRMSRTRSRSRSTKNRVACDPSSRSRSRSHTHRSRSHTHRSRSYTRRG